MSTQKYIHPQTIAQNTNESITKNGLYDLSTFSKHEIDTIVSVMRVAYSDKYPVAVRSLGLLNEANPITYKPRYVLLELIVKLFDSSKRPYDLLAVAEAYRLKGVAYRVQALEKYERYLSKANIMQKRYVKKTFVVFSDLFLYNNLSDLYEKEHNLYRALKYAELAENYNTDKLPYYPVHISKILLKIDPEKSVEYLTKTLENGKYKYVDAPLRTALQEARQKAYAGYKYKPKGKRVAITSFDEDVEKAALTFLPGGKYYDLWAK